VIACHARSLLSEASHSLIQKTNAFVPKQINNKPGEISMEIAVCVKRVPLVGSTFILTDDSMSIDTARIGATLSPHEENAVEAAVRLIETHGGSITLFSVGSTESEEQLREQLAIGADRAVLIETDGAEVDSKATAAMLAQAIGEDTTNFDLVLLGSESVDSGGYQTGIRISHALGLPVVTNVKGLNIEGSKATCERAVGSSREIYEVNLPAVVTVLDGLNIPRYPSVPGRIKARKKPIDRVSVTIPALTSIRTALRVPVSTSKGATNLGTGPEAAKALVEVFKQIGVMQ
jgi:electron transfer flavoprotein beta subunit